MAYQSVEKMLPKVKGNVYKLTIMAAKRAQELAVGRPKLVEAPLTEKLATTALREIQANMVGLVEEPKKATKKKK